MRRLGGLLLALAVLGLAACANGTRPGSASGSASPAGSPGGASPSATSAAPPAGGGTPSVGATGLLVQFGRQGGIAGFNDQLTVRADGGYTVVRTKPAVHRSGTMSAADLAELRKVLAQADFAGMPKVQAAKGADLFTYNVVYAGNQVLAMDGGIDERLKPVISTLSGLMAKYSG